MNFTEYDMKRIGQTIAFALLAGFVLTLSACGTDYSTPEATLTAYAKAVQAKDVDAMIDCYVKGEQEKARKEFEKNKEKEDAKPYTITSKGSKKDGDWTIGTLEIKEEGQDKGMELEVVLVEEDGAWKISDQKSEDYQKEKIKKMMEGGGE